MKKKKAAQGPLRAPDYKHMYLCLFNAVTDALRELEAGDAPSAGTMLRDAQQKCEEMYIDPR